MKLHTIRISCTIYRKIRILDFIFRIVLGGRSCCFWGQVISSSSSSTSSSGFEDDCHKTLWPVAKWSRNIAFLLLQEAAISISKDNARPVLQTYITAKASSSPSSSKKRLEVGGLCAALLLVLLEWIAEEESQPPYR